MRLSYITFSNHYSTHKLTHVSCLQVFSRASDQEPCGWWRAIVKMIKGDFHVVEYVGWETTYTEIVPSDR